MIVFEAENALRDVNPQDSLTNRWMTMNGYSALPPSLKLFIQPGLSKYLLSRIRKKEYKTVLSAISALICLLLFLGSVITAANSIHPKDVYVLIAAAMVFASGTYWSCKHCEDGVIGRRAAECDIETIVDVQKSAHRFRLALDLGTDPYCDIDEIFAAVMLYKMDPHTFCEQVPRWEVDCLIRKFRFESPPQQAKAPSDEASATSGTEDGQVWERDADWWKKS